MTGVPLEPGWAVAIIEPNRDFEADMRLRRAGFRTVFLTYRKRLTGHAQPGWRQATDFVSWPILAGYLFIELWPDQEWPRVERIPGYLGLVDNGRRRLEHEEVLRWRDRMYAGEFDEKRPETRKEVDAKFRPANSEEERLALLREFRAHLVGTEMERSA